MNKRIGVSIVLSLGILSMLYFTFFEDSWTKKKEVAAQSEQKKEPINEENNQAKEIEVVSESEKESAYIVFDGYYYMKTGQVVPELSSDWKKVGEVKRIGDWAIKKSGDSNEVPPGPIYQMDEKDKSIIATKGVYYEDGTNKEGYLLFKKGKEVKEDINPDTIQSAVSDKEELAIAFNNAKEHFPDLYAFLNDDHYQLHLLNAMGNYESIKMIYMVPEQKDTSILVLEYKNNIPLDSAFHKKRKPPIEQDELDINNMNWTIYKDPDGLYLAETTSNQKHYEIQFAGNVELSFVEETLQVLHKVN